FPGGRQAGGLCYYPMASKLDVIRALHLEGALEGDLDNTFCTLKWINNNSVGIECHFPETYPPEDDYPSPRYIRAGSLLSARGIHFQGSGGPNAHRQGEPWVAAGTLNHGIYSHARLILDRCHISDWDGDGLFVWGPGFVPDLDKNFGNA